jgi:hypothetical protein
VVYVYREVSGVVIVSLKQFVRRVAACLFLAIGIAGAAICEDSSTADGKQLSVDVARDRAVVMQDVYKATLVMLHERYFHRDRSVLPARAMQDIFADIERQSHVEARWISASLKPMSIDHTPESEFEKRAAKEIAAGSAEVEVVEDGYFRRAVAIPFTGGCLSCHEGVLQNNGRKKFAGLVVSIPLREKESTQPTR